MQQLEIRLARPEDTPAILEIYAPFIEAHWASFETVVPDTTQMWKRIERIMQRDPWLVAISNGRLSGYAYAAPHRGRQAYQWNREVSAYVHSDLQGLGIASRLYDTLFRILKWQGYMNLLAGIVTPNPSSIAFHEKMGFTLLGTYRRIGYKMGAWRDVQWYEKWIGSDGQPDELKTIRQISRQEWNELLGSA